MAIVTTKKDTVNGGGSPVFIVNSRDQLQKTSLDLGKILDASAHEINPDTMIIVKR